MPEALNPTARPVQATVGLEGYRQVVDIQEVRAYLAKENGLAIVSTTQADGRVLSSVVNCGVIDHPITGVPCVAFVSAGGAARLSHVRRDSQVTAVMGKEEGLLAKRVEVREVSARLMATAGRRALPGEDKRQSGLDLNS